MGKKAVKALVPDVVAFCRMFANLERDAVCCGSVTVPQCVLLQTLLDGSWDVSTLAERMSVTKGAMTRLVDGVETRGWVKRVQDTSDKRRFSIELTPRGTAEANRLADCTEQAIEAVLRHIPSSEHAAIANAVKLLRGALDATQAELGQICG